MEAPQSPPDPPANKFISDPKAFLRMLQRLMASNDNVAYRTSGGLRIMLRNEPNDDQDDISFDVSVVIEDEPPAIERAMKNEIDIMEDESGCLVIEEYSFMLEDTETLNNVVEFLNAVDLWCVCPCGEYLIKDNGKMCYYCEMTAEKPDPTQEDIFCPICHESGHARWMMNTSCCKQKMHRKCRETCIASAGLRLQDAQCPMCRASWE